MEKVPKALYNVRWETAAPKIRFYLQHGKEPKYLPRILRKHGAKNFEYRNKKLYAFGRQVVWEDHELKKIIEVTEDQYGSARTIHLRLMRKYIGVSLRKLEHFLNASERRQVKARRQTSKLQQQTFIVSPRPGSIQADCMFFHGDKLVVFGMVDEYSRFVHYEVIKHKTPIETGAALQWGLAAMAKVLPSFKVWKVSTDAGPEFLKDALNTGKAAKDRTPDFRSILEKLKVRIVFKKQPQRMIESTNRVLRLHVERVDFKDKAELKKIVADFVKQKNETPHAETKEAPVDLLKSGADASKRKTITKAMLKSGRKRTQRKGKRTVRVLKPGDLVRIALTSDKDELGHAGFEGQWSKKLYVVVKTIGSTRGPDRFSLKLDGGGPVKGYYMRHKLLWVKARPTHNLDKKRKYQPGVAKEGDLERQQQQVNPDSVPDIQWANQKTYKDMADERDSSGDEASVAEEVEESPPRRSRRPRRKAPPKEEFKIIGRKLKIFWEGVFRSSPVVCLGDHHDHLLVRFRDGTVHPCHKNDVHHWTNDFLTPATIKKWTKAAEVELREIKKEIDARRG